MKEKMAIIAAAKYAMNDEERNVAKKAWLDGYEAGQVSPAEWNNIPEVLPSQGAAVLVWSESEGLQIAALVGDFFYEQNECFKVFPTHWIDMSRALKVPNEY